MFLLKLENLIDWLKIEYNNEMSALLDKTPETTLIEAGLLEPVSAVHTGVRQFALFRQNGTNAREILKRTWNRLPCDRVCTLRMP